MAGQILQFQAAARGQGMPGRGHHHQRMVAEHTRPDGQVTRGRAHQCDVQGHGAQILCDAALVANLQLYVDAGVLRPEGGKDGWREIFGGGNDPEPDAPALQALQCVDLVAHVAQGVLDGIGGGQNAGTGLLDAHSIAGAVEERQAERFFHLLDLERDGRRRQPKGARRRRDRSETVDCLYGAKLPQGNRLQGHRPLPVHNFF